MNQLEADCPLMTLQHYFCEFLMFFLALLIVFGFMTHRLDSYQPHFLAGGTLQKFL